MRVSKTQANEWRNGQGIPPVAYPIRFRLFYAPPMGQALLGDEENTNITPSLVQNSILYQPYATFGLYFQQHAPVNTTLLWVTSSVGDCSPHQGASVVGMLLKRSLLLRVVATPSRPTPAGDHRQSAAWPSRRERVVTTRLSLHVHTREIGWSPPAQPCIGVVRWESLPACSGSGVQG